MIEELKTIVTTSNALYEVQYEESKMMNLKADEKHSNARFAYIEEFTQGSYTRDKFVPQKTTQVQIYFCRFGEFHSSAMDRETLRSQIETEIVLPFMQKYNDSHLFDRIDNWKFFTPMPRFDANEVSIMLQFDCKQNRC